MAGVFLALLGLLGRLGRSKFNYEAIEKTVS